MCNKDDPTCPIISVLIVLFAGFVTFLVPVIVFGTSTGPIVFGANLTFTIVFAILLIGAIITVRHFISDWFAYLVIHRVQPTGEVVVKWRWSGVEVGTTKESKTFYSEF